VRGFATSNSWLSKEAPTFSSSGDPKTCVTSLGLNRIATLILSGKPNKPVPDKFNVDIEEFGEGATLAVEVVTRGLADGDYSSLEGLVSEECIDSLKGQNLQNLNDEKKNLLAVNASDIFFHMLAEIEIKPTHSEILFVTFSLPQLGMCKVLQQEHAKNKEAFNVKMKEALADIKAGVIDKDQLKEVTEKNIKEFKESVNDNDSFKMFKENEIQIGNYRFTIDNTSSNWVISQISQVNTVGVWPWIFRQRWKGRVGMHLKGGFNFYKILRYEYCTDWICLLLMSNVVLVSSGMQ